MNQKIIDNEAIYRNLILALLNEFNHIRETIRRSRYEKHKTRLWNNLFRCAETLLKLLEAQPEQSDVDQWLKIIAEKAPKKFLKHAKEMIEKLIALAIILEALNLRR
ncbi:hypothetical protein J7L18_00150 [Candidatus Bathyarchaeota archaeon]|nr:hypothetical protein [Candidatus Bathyarchaeota archaeon]